MRALFLIVLLLTPLIAEENPRDPSFLANQGRFTEAAAIYAKQANQHQKKGNELEAIKAHLNAASCLKMHGDISAALTHTDRARPLVEKSKSQYIRMIYLSQIGSLLAMGKEPSKSIKPLETALDLAKALKQSADLAEISNDLGLAHSAMAEHEIAVRFFASSESLARQVKLPSLSVKARQNHLIATFQAWDGLQREVMLIQEVGGFTGHAEKLLRVADAGFRTSLSRSISSLNGRPATPLYLYHTITAGMTAVRYGMEKEGFALLYSALKSARQSQNHILEASALLTLAELYLDHRRGSDAALILEQARPLVKDNNPILMAQLELLSARKNKQINALPATTKASIDRAIAALTPIRSDMARTRNISDLGRSFREKAGLPYLLLADHYLSLSGDNPANLRAAQQAMERFKSWEMEDYFRDDCVNLALGKKQDLTSLDGNKNVGVLYVIPLPDRTEVLLLTPQGPKRWRAGLSHDELYSQARIFRHRLESDYGTMSFLEPAKKLYKELIHPGLTHLRKAGVKHLVFVPDGPLANLPLSALVSPDTGRYLIQDYSVSIAPSLALAGKLDQASAQPKVVMAGLSQASQGYPALPGVSTELAGLRRLFPQHKQHLNKDFTHPVIAETIRTTDASIIHLATHGEFGKTADQTFLLTHKGKIRLNQLEEMIRPKKYRGRPVELLCLSACRTALGDDRAALGFAGIAVKSGSRSVLASLWYIDDKASSQIILNFYQNLKKGTPKAEALRQAQLRFIGNNPQTIQSHPRLWAPFILIGNWN